MSVKEENSANSKELFLKIGLDEKTATDIIRFKDKASDLTDIIYEAGVSDGCEKTTGDLLYSVANGFPKDALVHRSELIKYIMSSKIEAAFKYFKNLESNDFNVNEFEEVCGVGVDVSAEDIEKTVSDIIEENKNTILQNRYREARKLLGDVRKKLPWVDPKIIIKVIGEKLCEVLGEKTAADNEKPAKKKEKKEKPASEPSEEELNPYSIFPQPEHNKRVHTEVPFSDGSVLRYSNTRELLDKHLKETGGNVYTRFPPEPNGYLHIGHAKAMFVNFGLAKERGGCCYLRFDDTNPDAERREYIDHIEEIVKWMGWEPFKITYTSDYFQELYEFAVKLIESGHAYVDHQTKEEIKEYREKKLNSPWRDRPIEESLKLFEEMKRGNMKEEEATLRMKMDMQNDNCNMYDLIAYRIKLTPHPHAGDKWFIYPSYDYAHCIVDSLENITHSLCTLEFETRRASYYWLLHSLGLYMPHLHHIVRDNHVNGWDDPRLMTLAGLRRRGVTPTAINAFIRGLGITRSDASMINVDRLEFHIKEELGKTAPRTMVVINPLKVVITNMESDKVIEFDAQRWYDGRDDPSVFYKVPFSRVVYIERDDFRMVDSKDYYGLAPGKTVQLKYAYPIKCIGVVRAVYNETIVEVHAEYVRADESTQKKLKGCLHWVAEPSPGKEPLKVEIRLFDKLFNSQNPSELENWLDDINTNSRKVVSNAFAVPTLKEAVLGDKFQFERKGYFAVDKDSTPDKLVFNRTVEMNKSSSKARTPPV
ncbi:hypothetical protein CARUB_v10022284mg [Capsella rubella]|uniref:glutamine--tRNA ligase n=1 Tax=Capsella rubella TaxID=81985 RepID=R0HXX8_9BRAS|nr:hypothetical protein CARUB_v10022284mg [Capsella rubella]